MRLAAQHTALFIYCYEQKTMELKYGSKSKKT